MSSSDEVRRYFDHTANDFDAIYRADRPLLRRLRDSARRTVTARLTFVEELVAEHAFHDVLDVGCGSGRFGVALAQQGVRVLGLDFAPQMVELAASLADEHGVSELAKFEIAGLLEWTERSVETFDLAIAMGVFDYVEEPVPLLHAMAARARGEILASFPKLFDPWVPMRWMKFRLARCPLFLFRRSDVERVAAEAELEAVSIVPFRRDYLLRAKGTAT